MILRALLFSLVPLGCFAQGLLIDVGYSGGAAAGGSIYLLEENFEGTGAPSGWATEAGGPDYDYTVSPLQGAQSLRLEAPAEESAYGDFTATADTVYLYFRFALASITGADRLHTFLVAGGSSEVSILELRNDGSMRVIHGGVESAYASGTITTGGVTNHVWVTFTRNTGGNNGFMSVGFSTDGIKPTSGSNFTSLSNGASVGFPGRCRFRRLSGDFKFDRVLVSESVIGNNP